MKNQFFPRHIYSNTHEVKKSIRHTQKMNVKLTVNLQLVSFVCRIDDTKRQQIKQQQPDTQKQQTSKDPRGFKFI